MTNLCMGITIVKFHPFEGLVPRIELEFHGDSHSTTPMARNAWKNLQPLHWHTYNQIPSI